MNMNTEQSLLESLNAERAKVRELSLALRAIVNGPVIMSHMANNQLSEQDPKVIAARKALANANIL